MTAETSSSEDARWIDPADLLDDPHASLGRLRAETAVIRTGEHRYTVLRARDVAALLKDPRTLQVDGAAYARFNGIPDGHAAAFLAEFFLFSNGDRHRAGRGPFASTFAHGAIRALRGEVRETAERIVAGLPRGEAFDFVATAASRAPAEMIAAILGLPREDAPRFAALVYVVANLLGPVYPIERHAEIDAAAKELNDYVRLQLSLRAATPRDDVLSRVVALWQDERGMSFESLAHQVMGLIIGGSDTTRAAIATITALLLQHPEQWAALRADPALVPGAVSEGLRFDPAVGSTVRLAVEPIAVGDVIIPAGVMIGLSTLSALRDPELYPEPDRFDIRRQHHPKYHLVFGGGAHRCIGEMLARVEIEEMIAALARKTPDIELISAPRLVGCGGIRQVTPMAVRIPEHA